MQVDRLGSLRALGEKGRQLIGECTFRKKWGYERDFVLLSFVLEQKKFAHVFNGGKKATKRVRT